MEAVNLWRCAVKRWTLLLGLWCGLTLLSGCLPVTSAPTETVTPTPTASLLPDLTPTPALVPVPRLTTLTVWVPDFLDPYGEAEAGALLQAQIQAFAAATPDVQVQVVVKASEGAGGLYNLLRTAYTAAPAVLPDLVILDSTQLQAAAQEGIIRPLPLEGLDASDFYSFTLQSIRVEEQAYGLPFLTQVDQTVYRAGVAAAPPFSWTQVLTGGYSLLFPAAPPDGLASDALLMAYRGSGGAVTDEAGNPTLDRARLEDLYRFFGTMTEAGLLDVDQALALPDAAACWALYQTGVGRMAVVPAGEYWAALPPDSLPGWIPTPAGLPVAQGELWAFAMVAQDPNRQALAIDLATWLTAPEQTSELALLARRLPARRGAVVLLPLSTDERLFIEQLLAGAFAPLPPTVDPPVRRALQGGLEALLQEQADSPEAAAALALTVLRR